MALISLSIRTEMEFLSFDAIIGFIAAFGSFCLAISLFGHVRREKAHFFLALLLANISAGFILRSANWVTGEFWMTSVAYLFFALLPLFLALFIESLLNKPLPTLFKVTLLGTLTFLVFTCWFYDVRTTSTWKSIHMCYHIGSFSILLGHLFIHGRQSRLQKQEWHVYKSIMYCMSLGLFFLVLEWLYALGPMQGERVRLAAFAQIIFIHNLVNIYFNEHEFSFRKEVVSLTTFFVFSAIVAKVLVTGGMVIGPFPLMTALIFATAITFSSLNLQIISGFSGSGLSKRILQLVKINKSAEALFLKDLNRITEFKNLTLIQPEILEARDCEDAYKVLNSGQVLSIEKIRTALEAKDISSQMQDNFQAALFLLQSTGVKSMVITRPNGPILAATPIALRSTTYFENLLLWAAQNFRLIEEAHSNNTKNTEPAKRSREIEVDA